MTKRLLVDLIDVPVGDHVEPVGFVVWDGPSGDWKVVLFMVDCPDSRIGDTGCSTCGDEHRVANPLLVRIEGYNECSHGFHGPHCIRDSEGSCPFEYDRDNPHGDCRCEQSQWNTAWSVRDDKKEPGE